MSVVHGDGRCLTMMFAIFVASLMSSIAGFAFSAICGAMLFHLTSNPVEVVQIMMICSIANQAAMTWATRHDIDWPSLLVYLTGGMFGLLVRVWILLHADRSLYTHVMGIFLLSYGAYMLLRKPLIVNHQHVTIDLAVGFLGGITGGAAAFPGMPVTIWCNMKGWLQQRRRPKGSGALSIEVGQFFGQSKQIMLLALV